MFTLYKENLGHCHTLSTRREHHPLSHKHRNATKMPPLSFFNLSPCLLISWFCGFLSKFWLQERQRGLRVTVLEGLPSASQPGFIDAFLLPFFTALLPMAPGLDDEYIPNLRDNR